MENSGHQDRKNDHIEIVLHEDVASTISNGFEKYTFRHQALPDVNFNEISTNTLLFGKKLASPLFISSMTGGTSQTGRINQNLAVAAQQLGIAMGVGSQRPMLENQEASDTYNIRQYAPDIVLFANIGAVQLNYSVGVDEIKRIIDVIQADALIIHLNSLQEVFQPEGELNFAGLFSKIASIVKTVSVPVIIKEVGWGIDGKLAERLASIGVSAIDVAGAGGTSWSQVERFRHQDPIRYQAADAFRDWGIPTAESLMDVLNHVHGVPVFASGGLSTGVEAAKAIALGATLCGYARRILPAANKSADAVIEVFQQLDLELRIAMFGIGAKNLQELSKVHLDRK